MILFGEKTVPSEAEAFVTVRLPCNGWTVDHFETDDADIKIRQDGETTDGLKRLRVVQRISQIGDHKSAIQIIVRRPDHETEAVRVGVSYYGQTSLANQ
jgi:hypothetical protein